MADAAAWRVQVRQRVASADGLFRNAYNRLRLAWALMEMPVPPSPPGTAEQGPLAWFPGYRLKHVLAKEQLTEANLDLYYAIVSMEEAEILALHGCSLDHTSLPLQSIDDLGPQEAALKTALANLQFSRVVAENTRKTAERCRSHLWTQIALIDSFYTSPDATLIALITAEQTSAYHALAYAIHWTFDARSVVVIAQQFV